MFPECVVTDVKLQSQITQSKGLHEANTIYFVQASKRKRMKHFIIIIFQNYILSYLSICWPNHSLFHSRTQRQRYHNNFRQLKSAWKFHHSSICQTYSTSLNRLRTKQEQWTPQLTVNGIPKLKECIIHLLSQVLCITMTNMETNSTTQAKGKQMKIMNQTWWPVTDQGRRVHKFGGNESLLH